MLNKDWKKCERIMQKPLLLFLSDRKIVTSFNYSTSYVFVDNNLA